MKRFFGKDFWFLFLGSMILCGLSCVFDETRDEMRNKEMIDNATKKAVDEFYRKLKKEGKIR